MVIHLFAILSSCHACESHFRAEISSAQASQVACRKTCFSPLSAAARGDLAARYRCSLILEQFITHRPEIMWRTVARGIYYSAVGIIRLKAAENGLIELDRGDWCALQFLLSTDKVRDAPYVYVHQARLGIFGQHHL
jgi:hypothetical protein